MKRALLRCLLALCVSMTVEKSLAQITISESNVQAIFGPGTTLLTYVDTTSQTVNVGSTGGPNTYDFSSLPFVLLGRDTSFSISQFPNLAPRYPSGANVLQQRLGPGSATYFISTISSSQLSSHGDAFVDNASGFEFYSHANPAEILVMLPVTFNAPQFSQTVVHTDTFYVGGVPFSTDQYTVSSNANVDGWGTLILPGPLQLSCLRMRVEESPDTGKEFRFLTREGAIVIVQSSTSQPNTGVVAVDEITYLRGGSISSVRTAAPLPSSFTLFQNYPNPFNPSTIVRFDVPGSSEGPLAAKFVSLKVYNMLGQEVATLVNEELEPGSHEVTWDAADSPGGVYFYRLRAGDASSGSAQSFVETKKLILLK